MTARRRKYSKEEFAQHGDTIYDRDVAPHVKSNQKGQFAAIDIETGDFEIDPDELTACNRLLARRPEAQIWLQRIGLRYTYRMLARTVAT